MHGMHQELKADTNRCTLMMKRAISVVLFLISVKAVPGHLSFSEFLGQGGACGFLQMDIIRNQLFLYKGYDDNVLQPVFRKQSVCNPAFV